MKKDLITRLNEGPVLCAEGCGLFLCVCACMHGRERFSALFISRKCVVFTFVFCTEL